MKKALLAFGALMLATSANAADATFSLTAVHDGNLYVLDSNISGEDCIAAIADVGSVVDLDGRLIVSIERAQLACQLEKPATFDADEIAAVLNRSKK